MNFGLAMNKIRAHQELVALPKGFLKCTWLKWTFEMGPRQQTKNNKKEKSQPQFQ